MPESGGLDIATLGLRVDGRPVRDATSALDQFTQAGAKAEQQAGRIGATSEREFRRSAAAAREGARAQVDAIEREYQLSEAAIKEAVARGFISPKEAAKAGRDAAQAYNASLVQVIDRVQSAGGLNRNTKAGADAFLDLTGSLKNVDAAGRRAGLGLGRLNDAMVTVARQGLGLNSVSGKLIDTVGTFAIGTAYMVPVLAGLAAIGFAWQKLTEESRKAREEAEKAIATLNEAARLRELGPAGEVAETLAASLRNRARLERELAIAERQSDSNSITGAALGTARSQQRHRDPAKIRADLEEVATAIEEGQRQIFENLSREQERIDAERERANQSSSKSASDAIRIEEQKAAGLERLAAETKRRQEASAGVVAELAQQLAAERRLAAANAQGADAVAEVNRELAREQALRQALANAVPGDVAAITRMVNAVYDLRDANADAADLRQRTSKEFEDSLNGLETAHEQLREEQERSAQAAQAWRDAWVNAAFEVASAFGDSARNAAAFTANAFDAIQLAERTDQQNEKRAIGLGVVGGFAGAAISSILDNRAERAAAVKAAAEEFDRVLDDYVATLADRNRFDQLAADAEGGARGALDALLNSLLADLSTRGSFGAEAAQKIKDAIAQGIDSQGLEAILGQFGSEGQQILSTYLELLRQIEEERQKEIDAATNSLRVRELLAQGRDEEAAALERRLEYEQQIKDALELGDKALADYTRSVQEQEEAALAAAKAERERTEALERQRQTVQDRLDVEGREAALRGDDRGAFKSGLVGRALSEQAALDDRLAKGEIEIDLYRRLSEVIDQEVLKALEDFDNAARAAAEAALEAARAEEFRQAMDLENLRIRGLLAQGLDDEAFALKQQLELLQAVEQKRSAEYIALLKQVQAQELANREAQKAADAAKESAQAQEELTRALDGGLKVLGGPAGFTAQLQSYRNQALRYGGGPGDLGVSSPNFTPTTNNTFEIVIQTQPGQDNVTIGQQVYEQIVAEVARQRRLGGFNRLGAF